MKANKNKTVNEYLRDRIYTQCGINRPKPFATPEENDADIAIKLKEIDNVVKLAKNRLIFGTFRYGTYKYHENYDYGKEIIIRVNKYFDSGNLEYLIDAFNFCYLEFCHPHISNAHFISVDDGEHTKKIGEDFSHEG